MIAGFKSAGPGMEGHNSTSAAAKGVGNPFGGGGWERSREWEAT